jgi:replication fork clamp-binding protein CrfC
LVLERAPQRIAPGLGKKMKQGLVPYLVQIVAFSDFWLNSTKNHENEMAA